MKDDQAEKIVKIFKNAGLTIESGAQFSVRGQIASITQWMRGVNYHG